MKKPALLILFCLSLYIATAQSTAYYNRMNHVFGAIDKNKVTTGLLKEFGVRLNHVENYHGSLNSTNWVDRTQWRSLYYSLYSMRVGTAASMTAPASVYTNLESQQVANPNTVLLAAQYYTYQQYKTNAYSNGDVTVSNDRIYDVTGRNPYDTKTAFAVAPMEYHLEGNSFSFKLQSNMIYTNTTKTLSSVQVDFGNGQGYQTISLNTLKYVTYPTGGEKELRVKFVYSGGPTLYSHSKLWVEYDGSIVPTQARFDGFGVTNHVITGAAYQGATATGDITVELAPGHTQLTRPFIVVEGFDPFDDFDYDDLIDDNDPGGIDIEINTLTGLTLNQAIEDEGYDLVFVNFQNSTDYIQRNAYMVEAVIEWVNNNKTGTQENVVMGMSMGALVARYALRHMETTSRTHETGLYISHDAPHQGANVPLAYQAFVRHLAGESIGLPVFWSVFTINVASLSNIAPDLEDGMDLLQSPAAQQMLIYQLQGTGGGVSIDNTTLYSSFSTEYRNLGYPSQGSIRNIAISNGSECGSPLDFGPYATLADINQTAVDLPFFVHNIAFALLNGLSLNPIKVLTSFLSTNTDIKAEFKMRALPSQQSQQVYKGKIFVKKTILGFINVEEQLINQKILNSASSMLPLDNAGGGIYDINQFISLPPSLSAFIKEQQFSFIPTYSSLDIGGGSQTITTSELARVYSPLAPPGAPKNTPFHNFFTNPTISQNHTQFTLENGNWLLDELQGTPAFYTCVSTCSNPPELNVSGTSVLCTSNSAFSLPNLPAGTGITWNVSPTNLFAVDSGTGTSFTTRATGSSSSGQGTIIATIAAGVGCANIPISKSLWVGKPAVPSIDPGDVRMDVPPRRFTVFANQPPTMQQVTSYNWYLDGSMESEHTGTAIMDRDFPWCGGSYNVELETINVCGTSSKGYLWVYEPSCGGSFLTISPNPASEEITITFDSMEDMEAYFKDIAQPLQVQITDFSGNEKYRGVMNKNGLKVNLRNAKKGIYLVRIYDKDFEQASRLVVE